MLCCGPREEPNAHVQRARARARGARMRVLLACTLARARERACCVSACSNHFATTWHKLAIVLCVHVVAKRIRVYLLYNVVGLRCLNMCPMHQSSWLLLGIFNLVPQGVLAVTFGFCHNLREQLAKTSLDKLWQNARSVVSAPLIYIQAQGWMGAVQIDCWP